MSTIIYPLAIIGLLLFAYLLHIVGNRFKYLIKQQNLKRSMILNNNNQVITSDTIQKYMDNQVEVFREYMNQQGKIQKKLLADNRNFRNQIEQLKVKKTSDELIKTILIESLRSHVRKMALNDTVIINGHRINSDPNLYYLSSRYSPFNSLTNNKIELESPNYN